MGISDEEDFLETMVIDLGTVTTKAAWAGEKTCRYICNTADFISDDKVIETGEKEALAVLIRSCYDNQYGDKIDPQNSRLLVIVPLRKTEKVKMVAEVALDVLKVQSFWLVCPGEVSVLYNSMDGTAISIDIGEYETRIVPVLNYKVHHDSMSYVDIGGFHVTEKVKECLNDLDCNISPSDVKHSLWKNVGELSAIGGIPMNQELLDCKKALFGKDLRGESIEKTVRVLLTQFPEINRIIFSGAPSMILTKEYFISQLSEPLPICAGLQLSLSMCPERNKSTWLGGSVFGSIECKHVFFKDTVEAVLEEMPKRIYPLISK